MYRKQPVWKQLRRHLISLVVVSTLLVLAAVAAFTYFAYQAAAEDLVIERDRQLTFLSALRLKDEMAKFTDELESLARSYEISNGDSQRRQAALAEARHRLTIFDAGVVLLDAFGRVESAEPLQPEIMGKDWSDRLFFRELLISQRPYYSDEVVDPDLGLSMVVISVPVMGASNEFEGALVGMFRLGEPRVSAFYASIVRLRIGNSGTTYVLDSSGHVLYDSDYARIGETYQVPETASTLLQGMALRTRDVDGNEIVAAYASVPGTSWVLLSEDDWKEVTRSTRAYAQNLLLLLVAGMLLPAAGVVLLVRDRDEEERQRERIERDKRVAMLIQDNALPKFVPRLPGWDIAVYSLPVATPGEDFYDFMLLPEGSLMLAVGEIQASGIAAAHVLATARASLRSAAHLQLAPAQVLAHTNTVVCPESSPELRLACLYALLEADNGHLTFANAGLGLPLIRSGTEWSAVGTSGAPLNASLSTRWQEASTTLTSADSLFFYTSGLLALRNPSGEALGSERLGAMLAATSGDAQSIVDTLVAELKNYAERGWDRQFDITILVLRRL